VAVEAGAVAVGAPGHGPTDRGKVYLFLDPAMSIPEVAPTPADELLVHPNPVQAGGTLHLVAGTWQPGMQSTLLDNCGKVARSGPLMADGLVDTQALHGGTYLLRLCTEQDRSCRFARVVITP
jgi:hypothetical protein